MNLFLALYDSVGILANAFPLSVAAYNLFLDANHRKAKG